MLEFPQHQDFMVLEPVLRSSRELLVLLYGHPRIDSGAECPDKKLVSFLLHKPPAQHGQRTLLLWSE